MADRNRVRRSYDELGDTYVSRRSEDGTGLAVLEEFLSRCPDDAFVLDAGCGPGDPVLSRLTDAGAACGVDFSREQLRLAADAAPDASLVQGDMTALPVAADSVDAVVAYWSLIHVPIDDHRTVLEEFRRVLTADGRLLVCEGTNPWTGENPDWLASGVCMEWEIAGAEATRRRLEAVGFTVLDIWGVPEELREDTGGEGGADEPDGRDEHSSGETDGDDGQPWTFFETSVD